jgi:hypothetical protein
VRSEAQPWATVKNETIAASGEHKRHEHVTFHALEIYVHDNETELNSEMLMELAIKFRFRSEDTLTSTSVRSKSVNII